MRNGMSKSVAPASAPPRRWLPTAACVALIVIAVGATHGGAIRNGFVNFDDDRYIYENPQVCAGLSVSGVAWAFRWDNPETYFHPVTWLSLMADAEIFGVEPFGFHLTNVLLHCVSAIALFLLLLRTTEAPAPSWLAATLWAVHPLTVESVAWATERKAVLSTALALLACHAYVEWVRRRGAWRMAAVTVLTATAILAKPAIVVLPALLLVLDWWPLRRLPAAPAKVSLRDLSRLVVEKLPLAAVSMALLAVGVLSARSQFAAPEVAVPMSARMLHAIASARSYLGAAIWPTDLALFRPYPALVTSGEVAVGASLLVGCTAGAVLLARRAQAIPAGWAWFLMALAPYSGLMQTGMWPAWADRFAYVPLMGLTLAVSFGAEAATDRLHAARRVLAVLAVAAIVLYGRATVAQVRLWRDPLTLFEHSTRIEPRAAPLIFNYGKALIAVGRIPEAKSKLRAALEVDPRHAEALVDLGSILFLEGDLAGAEACYRRSLTVNPRFPAALFNLAELLARIGRNGEALPLYERFLRVATAAEARQVEVALRAVGR